MLKTKRIYDAADKKDGTRVLIMRLWPRGIRRDQVDEWNRDLAPSRELLFEIKHRGLAWEDYVRRYWQEISPAAVDALRRRARHETVTILCSCPDENRCHRGLLKQAVEGKRKSRPIRRRALSGSRAPEARSPARRGGRPATRS